MNEVSLFRLYVLRAMYLFIAVGLGVYLWPGVLNPQKHWELMEGQASCMLAAFSLLCVLGLRFPLQMLPVLLRGSDLEDALAHARSVAAMDGRPYRRVDQTLDLCHIHGRARLYRHSLALCVCALRDSTRRSLAMTRGIERKYFGIFSSVEAGEWNRRSLAFSLNARLYPYVLLSCLPGEGLSSLWLATVGLNLAMWRAWIGETRPEISV
jgi:hypothetical protein